MRTANGSPLGQVSEALSRPVAFYPVLARICGDNVIAALLLSQAIYWSKRTSDPDGWFYKTARDWKKEICITRHQLDGVRRKLVALGLLKCKLMGMPAKTH